MRQLSQRPQPTPPRRLLRPTSPASKSRSNPDSFCRPTQINPRGSTRNDISSASLPQLAHTGEHFYLHRSPVITSVPNQVFIAGETEDNNTQALLDVVRSRYIPGRILAVTDGPSGRAGLLYQRHESLSRLKPIQGKSAAYVCRNFACSLPVTEPEELANSLDGKGEGGQASSSSDEE